MRIILFLCILLGTINLFSQDYYSDRLFVKVSGEFKNSFTLDKDPIVTKLFSRTKVISRLPVSKHPLLSSTYEIVFEKEINLDTLVIQLNQLEQIDFAEKVPIYRLFFTPNDPLYSSQWNLAKIQADLAWNLGQGCTQVKIAVTDDGFLMNHEDLVNQWHINTGEINGNGIDDDGNGYIDDWRGWDAANNDNDPSATAPTNSFFTHGTHVAGIIAGQTHNSKGIAAIGYNCKMIPVKIGLSPNSSLTGAFQGLDYAINASGCDVINMSWGGGGWSATYQTLFNIAKTKGIICVAAAGNSNSSNDMYPASYNHVISVAASASTDARAWFSNYGSTIDVTAPGVDIQSCLAGATTSYGLMSGTSMASPLVAGLCGLMKCYNPMPADSIEACLKRTCDNIAAQNPILKDSLGAGRINAFQALQCLTKKPKSDFIALDTFQCIGKSVRYIAKSFGIPSLTYNWSFPGGSPSASTIANPVVTYGANGLKSTTLITCNSLGCDTITKTNYVNIDTPRAWLTNRKYTSYNSNPVIITVHFKGNPPFNVTLTDGTNNFTQSNIRSNPYFFSIVPKKDTSWISISSFSDSSCVGNKMGMDTIVRIQLSSSSFCRDSMEVNSAQTGWQALQTNGTWGSLSASSYCAGTFAANTSLFPGVAAANCLWGPIINTGSRTAYNSSSHTTTSTFSGSFPYLKKQFTLPTGSVIDSVRLWMISDDYIDSVWVNNKVVYKATNPIHYGQIVMTGAEINLGNSISPLNEVIVKPGDFGGCYGTYFRMKVYYTKDCSNVSCKDSTLYYTDTSNWYYQNTSGNWVKASLGINTCGQPSHVWSPINLIGIQNANQMIWGSTTSNTCNVKREINIPNVSVIDSIRVLVQADDNIVSFKVNGTHVTSTPFGWNNVSSVLINKSILTNGVNAFTIEGTNANGSCAWVAMKMIVYKDSCKTISSDCDTTNLNTGKVLHLDFNGNTQDKSGLGNHATNFGATPVTGKAGVANTAYRFNGTSNYMQVANSTSLNNFSGNKITLTAILKPRGFYNGACKGNSILMKGNTDFLSGNYLLRYSPINGCTASADTNQNNFYGSVSSSGGCSLSQIHNPPYVKRDTWYCIVVVYTGDSIHTYINGEKKYSCSYSGSIGSHNMDVFIGKLDNATYPYWLNADVDDIRIYNRVLAPSEVKGYCGTCNVPPTQINCNNWLKSTNTSDRITIGDLDITGNKVTVEALVIQQDTFSGTLDEREIVSKHFTPADVNYTLRANHGYITTTNGFFTTPPSCYNVLNKSYHIAMVYDGTSLTYYRNGFLMSQVAASGNLITNNYQTTIGNYAAINNLPTKGFINEVRIWNVARSQSQIRQYMNTSLPNPTTQTGLIGYYIFDNLLNKQGNTAYNGTLGGSAQINQTNPNCSLIIDSCGINTQPHPCDTPRRFTFTQCLNDSIKVLASAGSKYQWSPVSGLSNDTIRNPNVFVSNNQRYLVSYTSLKNCQLIDTIDVDVKAAAIYPKMEDQIICIGDSVQMTIPIYATNILWSPNLSISSTTSKNPFFFPTTNRTYYLEFRDTFGCLHRDTFIVNTKVCCPARARFTIPKDLLCFGETLPITNTSKGPITSYSWNFGSAIPNTFAGANPPILTFPSGGSYTLRLIVTNGVCFDTMTKTVSIIQINPNAGKDTNNCLAAFTTQLGESPISDWTYKWTPTQYLNDATIADPICSIVNDSINYILEIMDRNSGCKAYDTVVVYTNRTIDSTAQNLRICFGDSVLFNGIYRKTTNNYFYTIKKADGICDSFINLLRLNVLQKQINPIDTIRRCEFYQDAKGKKHTISFTQFDTIKSKTILNCDSIINIGRVEIYNKVYKDTTVAGCAPFRYNGKTYLLSKMKADSIRQRNVFMFDCDTIKYIHIIVHPKPKAVITPSIPNPVLYKQTVTLSASGGQTYFWLQTGSNVPDIYYKINDMGPKLFTVRVTDENDCWDTVSYLVQGKLPEKCYYGFPNVFSPNEDNLNDEYLPNMDECTEVIIFAIYDRWGEKVFETNQLKGWNGFFKGRPAPMGVYVYFAKLKTPWGIKEHQGSFTLMR
ncbi:MAG: S8 family serine peptidase [Chitinophagales bacterium]